MSGLANPQSTGPLARIRSPRPSPRTLGKISVDMGIVTRLSEKRRGLLPLLCGRTQLPTKPVSSKQSPNGTTTSTLRCFRSARICGVWSRPALRSGTGGLTPGTMNGSTTRGSPRGLAPSCPARGGSVEAARPITDPVLIRHFQRAAQPGVFARLARLLGLGVALPNIALERTLARMRSPRPLSAGVRSQ